MCQDNVIRVIFFDSLGTFKPKSFSGPHITIPVLLLTKSHIRLIFQHLVSSQLRLWAQISLGQMVFYGDTAADQFLTHEIIYSFVLLYLIFIHFNHNEVTLFEYFQLFSFTFFFLLPESYLYNKTICVCLTYIVKSKLQ